MIYGFDTSDEHTATGALLVYAVWRSRDRARFKITPDVWGQVERFVAASAKRATRLQGFLQALKPRLCCETLSPAAMRVGLAGDVPLEIHRDAETGAVRHYIQRDAGDQREFMVRAIEKANAREVLNRLRDETAWVVMCVRDRLERERPIEDALGAALDQIPTAPQEITHVA